MGTVVVVGVVGVLVDVEGSFATTGSLDNLILIFFSVESLKKFYKKKKKILENLS